MTDDLDNGGCGCLGLVIACALWLLIAILPACCVQSQLTTCQTLLGECEHSLGYFEDEDGGCE